MKENQGNTCNMSKVKFPAVKWSRHSFTVSVKPNIREETQWLRSKEGEFLKSKI